MDPFLRLLDVMKKAPQQHWWGDGCNRDFLKKAIEIMDEIQQSSMFLEEKWQGWGELASEVYHSECSNEFKAHWRVWVEQSWAPLFSAGGPNTKAHAWQFFFTHPAPVQWIEEYLIFLVETASDESRWSFLAAIDDPLVKKGYEVWQKRHEEKIVSWEAWQQETLLKLWEGFNGKEKQSNALRGICMSLPLHLFPDELKKEWWEVVQHWSDQPKKHDEGVWYIIPDPEVMIESMQSEGKEWKIAYSSAGTKKMGLYLDLMSFRPRTDASASVYRRHWWLEKISRLDELHYEEVMQSLECAPDLWQRNIQGKNGSLEYECNSAQGLIACWLSESNASDWGWTMERQYEVLEKLEALGVSVFEPDSTGVIPHGEHPWVKEKWLEKVLKKSVGDDALEKNKGVGVLNRPRL